MRSPYASLNRCLTSRSELAGNATIPRKPKLTTMSYIIHPQHSYLGHKAQFAANTRPHELATIIAACGNQIGENVPHSMPRRLEKRLRPLTSGRRNGGDEVLNRSFTWFLLLLIPHQSSPHHNHLDTPPTKLLPLTHIREKVEQEKRSIEREARDFSNQDSIIIIRSYCILVGLIQCQSETRSTVWAYPFTQLLIRFNEYHTSPPNMPGSESGDQTSGSGGSSPADSTGSQDEIQRGRSRSGYN
ncbi:hypothetical protein PG985_012005 [Apiospora marii]|uniref:Uncharacterized protein n=1 Tax=Apiospora marii TaxID=335849 RepID=A0ABR1RFJ7_9PEZI